MGENNRKIAVVIPCYKVSAHVLNVIKHIGKEVAHIYVVDDKCPEETGRLVNEGCNDSRVKVIFHEQNCGVGGAMISGYRLAMADGAEVVVKIDGDDQMDPRHIQKFVQPILSGFADYTKGNRFFDVGFLADMPNIRIFGNAVLSFVNKLASGYWDIMDPTNGYTAIHASVLRMLPLDKIENGYFFESDMLFRLNLMRAVVRDVPMEAKYGNEISNLSIKRVAREFPAKYAKRFFKRIFYNYFLRDFNIGSIELVSGIGMLLLGILYGIVNWYESIAGGVPATSGTVMLAALPVLLGFQLLIAAINYDIANLPKTCIHKYLHQCI